ncbi:tumor suppressor p53-binding protein [Anaeramoeba ignava]|uniref:Tumor suppressor p53-binding protein n=1 Tax=Anaeramoeba ignava TaxID=1746090 RepID=A0A9Q0LEE3_ANAIG|nr:tumor suppressor p53-binding protein [Anaeramoeba ignava]
MLLRREFMKFFDNFELEELLNSRPIREEKGEEKEANPLEENGKKLEGTKEIMSNKNTIVAYSLYFPFTKFHRAVPRREPNIPQTPDHFQPPLPVLTPFYPENDPYNQDYKQIFQLNNYTAKSFKNFGDIPQKINQNAPNVLKNDPQRSFSDLDHKFIHFQESFNHKEQKKKKKKKNKTNQNSKTENNNNDGFFSNKKIVFVQSLDCSLFQRLRLSLKQLVEAWGAEVEPISQLQNTNKKPIFFVSLVDTLSFYHDPLREMLVLLTMGIPILSPKWIIDSILQKQIQNPEKYILNIPKNHQNSLFKLFNNKQIHLKGGSAFVELWSFLIESLSGFLVSESSLANIIITESETHLNCCPYYFCNKSDLDLNSNSNSDSNSNSNSNSNSDSNSDLNSNSDSNSDSNPDLNSNSDLNSNPLVLSEAQLVSLFSKTQKKDF